MKTIEIKTSIKRVDTGTEIPIRLIVNKALPLVTMGNVITTDALNPGVVGTDLIGMYSQDLTVPKTEVLVTLDPDRFKHIIAIRSLFTKQIGVLYHDMESKNLILVPSLQYLMNGDESDVAMSNVSIFAWLVSAEAKTIDVYEKLTAPVTNVNECHVESVDEVTESKTFVFNVRGFDELSKYNNLGQVFGDEFYGESATLVPLQFANIGDSVDFIGDSKIYITRMYEDSRNTFRVHSLGKYKYLKNVTIPIFY